MYFVQISILLSSCKTLEEAIKYIRPRADYLLDERNRDKLEEVKTKLENGESLTFSAAKIWKGN